MADAGSGRRIADRYVLGPLLGRGGVGAVWRARDELLDRDVAVKEVQLPAGLSDEDRTAMRARVLREGRAAARLEDPGAVTVYDVLQEDERAYLVMQIIEAPTLAELVREDGPLPPEEAARIGLAVLSTLENAHAQGVVHRDVKPSNIFTAPDGRVWLTDFGIASVQGDPALTATGIILGTPSYLAPEQARDGEAGPPADVWALGATLYFAVQGVPPFDRGAPLPTVTAVLTEEPPPASRAGPLGGVLTDVLRKDPAERPTPARLRWMLQRVVDGEPVPAPASQPQPADRIEEPAVVATDEPGRGRSLAMLLSVLAGLAVLAVLAVNALSGGGEQAAPGATTPPNAGATTPETTEPEPTEPESTPAENPETTQPPQDDTTEVPEGWTTYTDDAAGYSLAHPADWEVVALDQTRTDFRDPDSGTYLRVDWTDAPPDSAVDAWQDLSGSFANNRSNYSEIRIEPVDYRDYEAALWEYTYSEGGANLHAYNLGFTDGQFGYALNLQTRADDWEEDREMFEAFKRAFDDGR